MPNTTDEVIIHIVELWYVFFKVLLMFDEDVAKIFSQVAWYNYSQMLEYLLHIS